MRSGESALLDRQAASDQAGAELRLGGLWLRDAGWARPPALCARWLGDDQKGLAWTSRISVRRGVEVHDLRADGGQWVVCDHDGNEFARAPVVVLANAQTAASLAQSAGGAINALLAVPGSIGRFATDQLPGVQCALSGAGYLLPPTAGEVIAGADYEGGPLDSNALAGLLMGCPDAVVPRFGTRSSVRYATRDHLPVAGAVPLAVESGSEVGARLPEIARLPGLFVLTGYGSRGLVWSAILAQLVAAQINGEPDPLDATLVDAVDPARFWRRDRLKRTIRP
jgi:tRNA 5-methylaminomethyl-2-thiouridine biosynthesis bifunctional protein